MSVDKQYTTYWFPEVCGVSLASWIEFVMSAVKYSKSIDHKLSEVSMTSVVETAISNT